MNEKKAVRGPPTCSASGKQVPLNLSEQRNRQFFCSECGARLPVDKARVTEIVVPRHQVPAETHEYRKKLEALERDR